MGPPSRHRRTAGAQRRRRHRATHFFFALESIVPAHAGANAVQCRALNSSNAHVMHTLTHIVANATPAVAPARHGQRTPCAAISGSTTTFARRHISIGFCKSDSKSVKDTSCDNHIARIVSTKRVR